ncbi:hypothetical protein [Kingella sp. (in: b-proteobacteria)]|uniref:hypothetical protein n=1 Tax=Kingella sp. (in: b-proteobacteria) TaxID=2020713 RepID=UPI0026DD2961|nr:hypothetical protein [Kingella sp. (in: b-proteobacteria)]MDO4657184.1 hypothetical protein [Kingella sp. (in: b-proteobacteria)]
MEIVNTGSKPYRNLRGFAHVLWWVGAVCGLLQDIFMYHNGTREPFALQATTAVAMLTCIGSALIVGAFALPRQPEI